MKLERDGKVAVLVSSGFGGGWSTWGDPESCFDGELAQAVLDRNKPLEELIKIATKNWPHQFTGGVHQLHVVWIPKGAGFEITEYDGSESLEYTGDKVYQIA